MKSYLPESVAESISEGMKRGISVVVDTSKVKSILMSCLDISPLKWYVLPNTPGYFANDYNDMIVYYIYQDNIEYDWRISIRSAEQEIKSAGENPIPTLLAAQRECEKLRKSYILSQIIFNG